MVLKKFIFTVESTVKGSNCIAFDTILGNGMTQRDAKAVIKDIEGDLRHYGVECFHCEHFKVLNKGKHGICHCYKGHRPITKRRRLCKDYEKGEGALGGLN